MLTVSIFVIGSFVAWSPPCCAVFLSCLCVMCIVIGSFVAWSPSCCAVFLSCLCVMCIVIGSFVAWSPSCCAVFLSCLRVMCIVIGSFVAIHLMVLLLILVNPDSRTGSCLCVNSFPMVPLNPSNYILTAVRQLTIVIQGKVPDFTFLVVCCVYPMYCYI